MKRLYISLAFLSFFFFSCTKEPASSQYDQNARGALSIEFDNIVGAADLQLNTGQYTNAAGDIFNVTKLKYFVSNFVLTNTNGTVYTIPQDSSYFLINEADENTLAPLLYLPEGEYKTLTFTLGVDSLRNTMDISHRTGVLDPTATSADMYWAWNSGYIFFKLEGVSPSSTVNGNVIEYHIGGFGGYNTATTNNLKTISLDLTARGVPQVKAGKETNIHLMVDILKALNGTTNMSFVTLPMIHNSASGKPVADNYVEMFRHDHTEN